MTKLFVIIFADLRTMVIAKIYATHYIAYSLYRLIFRCNW